MTINKVASEEEINFAIDKSHELPKRRTFFDLFHSSSPKLSKSYDVDLSFAEKKVCLLSIVFKEILILALN